MSIAHRAHKIELIVNTEQETHLKKAVGCARFVHNWGLEQWKAEYEQHKKDPSHPKPNQYSIRRKLNAIKRKEFPWLMEVSKCVAQMSLIHLGQAFGNFFRDPKQFKYPKHKKKHVHDSFTLSNDQFQVDGCRIRIPKLGWVRMREPLRFKGAKLLWATISRRGKRWYVSLSCELADLSHLKPAENQGTVGVDLGVKSLAVLSNHKRFDAVQPLKANLKSLRRLQRKLARSQKGGRNRAKLVVKIGELHRKIFNYRQNALHQLTHYLTSHFSRIVIEDLNVKGMLKNSKLSRSIADVGLYEFRRQLLYKAEQRGCEVVVADRFYPSSKTCGYCGQKNEELTLSDRHWVCPHCGAIIKDRDFNAAVNLKRYPERSD